MKSELGNEAFILSTRVINKRTEHGIQKHFEISSGIEEELDSVLSEIEIPQSELSLSDELMRLQKRVVGNPNKQNQMMIQLLLLLKPKKEQKYQQSN